MEKKIQRFIRIPYPVIKLDISANAKLLYGMVLSLTFRGDCKATNRYFAQELGLKTNRQVINLFNELKTAGAIDMKTDDDGNRIVRPLIMFSLYIVPDRKEKEINGGFESLDDYNGGLESI